MARRRKKKEQVSWEGLLIVGILYFVWNPIYQSTGSGYIAAGVSMFVGALILGTYILILRAINHKRNERLKSSGILEIDKMTGEQFEKYLAQVYKSMGYSVQMTSKTADYGADLILHKDGKKIIIQAKRYNSNVGIKAVQEVIGAINYYQAIEGWVVTNSYLTKNAKKLAESNKVKIIEREELIELSLKIKIMVS